MNKLIAIAQTDRLFAGSYTIVELLEGQQQAHFSGDYYKTEGTAKAQVTRRFKNGYYSEAETKRVSIEELRAEEDRRQAPVQQQEELQHEALVVAEMVEEVTVENKQAQAEAWVIEMDAVEVELQSATTYELFASCKKSLEEIKTEIEALGFQVERTFIGWKLIVQKQVVEATCAASTPTEEKVMSEQSTTILFYARDAIGVFACCKSKSDMKKTYTVRIERKWLYSLTCDCLAGQHNRDCSHRLQVDQALSDVRPTFSEQCAGVAASRETIGKLLASHSRPVERAA